MSTILQQLADQMLTALNASGRPAGVPLAKLWTGAQVETADLPYRTLAWTDESVERAGSVTSPLVRRKVTFAIEDLVTNVVGPPALGPQAAGEAMRNWSIQCLVAQRWGGLAIDTVEQSTSWKLEQAEVPLARIVHQFEVTFTTRATDAAQRT